jgi:membrane associated rhomboid family serine protease
MSLSDATQALGRHLVVRHGFTPLERLLGQAPELEGLFDALVARFDGEDLQVQGLLTDAGGDPAWAAQRAEALRRALERARGTVRGRIHAMVWVLCPDPARLQALQAALFQFDDGHFLSQVLVGRGVLGLDGGWAQAGRSEPQPGGQALAQALRDPGLDPGQGAEALTVEAREIDERSARRLLRPGPAPATWLLIGLNVAAYALQQLLAQQAVKAGVAPEQADLGAALMLGGNEPSLTLGKHEAWRMLASAFLHYNLLHIGMNMLALFSLGSVLERLAGPWRLISLYLVCAVGAGALSALMHQPGQVSLGASGAILGLAGALMAPRWRRAPSFPQGLALRLHQWLLRSLILTFGIGLALVAFGTPVFDNAAHTGGLLCGFAIGYLWPSFLVRSGPWKA